MENPKSGEESAQKDARDELLDERKSDATSDETVSDLRQSEKDSSSVSSRRGEGPSPDGAVDESDELKDADPI